MDCVEFERVLLNGESTPQQQAHLNSCSACASLQADFDFISSQAKSLLASDEPSPAVWNAIESRLRSEGLIRDLQPAPVGLPRPTIFDFFRRWQTAWLVPATAALVLVAVLRLHHPAGAGDNAPLAKQTAPPKVTKPAPAVSRDDQQLLSRVASRPPAQLAKYRADLDDANAFIRDAEAAAKSDPNDVYRQQMLINAYEQKQMLYDLAVDKVAEQ
jgi:hypothetical protein